MTSTKPLTASERYARFILSAWNKREFTELQAALAQPSSTRPATLPAVECERIDLIHDLGRDLLLSDNSGQAANWTTQNAALALVRHLARCE
jgi:hypothetical protein